jgi:hypothetical protein
MNNGRRNPHQECCVFSHIRYVTCQHEGCTKYVHQLCQRDWLKNIVMRCQLIFQLFAVITLKVMGYGLNSRQEKSLGHRMDVYQVQLQEFRQHV